MALGIALATYLYPANLDTENIPRFFLHSFLVPLVLMAGLWLISVRFLPLRETRTFGVRRPRFPFVKAGYVLIAVALAVSVLGLAGLLTGRGLSVLVNALGLAWGFIFPAALYCFHLDKRVKTSSALAVLEEDSRKPVLYLRAFNQESQFFVIGPIGKYGEYANSLHARLAREGDNVGLTFEEYFGSVITGLIGPFVALGSPEDYIPPHGADRIYATDTDWMPRFRELAQGAACILVEVGRSSNLRWEFDELRICGLQHKLFVVTRPEKDPGTRGSYAFYRMLGRLKGIQTISWEEFATDMRTMNYGMDVEDPGPGAIVGFDHQAQAVILTTGANLPDAYIDTIRQYLHR